MSNLTLDRDETSVQSAVQPTAVKPLAIDYDIEACTELMRGGSKSFFAASRLLPARVRAPAIALYAFCRLADDAIDNRHRSYSRPHSSRYFLSDLDRVETIR